MQNKPTYIDLFSGAGGFSLGFDQVGFENVFSVDNESSFCKTYKHNFPNHLLVQKDICELGAAEIQQYLKGTKVDVVIGGPPCQGFSMAGSIGRRFIDDPRNALYKEFVRVVSVVKPHFFIMENVARLFTYNKGKLRAEVISNFEELGYRVSCKVLNAADYGVPQMRYRVIFIGTLLKREVTFPLPLDKNHNTVKEALNSFPKLNSGEESNKVPNHTAMNHSAQMLKKMSFVTDGGSREEIPEHLRPRSGDVRKYIRYKSDAPAVCVTGDMRKIFHYNQNRALTVRELARLQSFPDNFEFKGSRISQQQQVGNAVPPLLAKVLAENILASK